MKRRILLTRGTKWSALRAWGMNIAKPRGMARARVAMACRLSDRAVEVSQRLRYKCMVINKG
jgi:hypothetical protein